MIVPGKTSLSFINLVSTIVFFYFNNSYNFLGHSSYFVIYVVIFDFLVRAFKTSDALGRKIVVLSFILPYFCAGTMKLINGVLYPYFLQEKTLLDFDGPLITITRRLLEINSQNIFSKILVSSPGLTYFGFLGFFCMELILPFVAWRERFRWPVCISLFGFHILSAFFLELHFEVNFFLISAFFLWREASKNIQSIQIPYVS